MKRGAEVGRLSTYRVHARGVDHTGGAALGDAGGAVGDVEAIAGPRVLFEDSPLVLGDREGLAREEGLVRLEVDALDDSSGEVAC